MSSTRATATYLAVRTGNNASQSTLLFDLKRGQPTFGAEFEKNLFAL
jgi:hypothetical protein